jgi:hypothetical protein
MGLRPTQGDEKRLGPTTIFYGTVALSFVIPSEAEGSAVLRTFRGDVFRQSEAEWRDLRFRGPFVETFFDRAYPDFLPRSTGHDRVCAFL